MASSESDGKGSGTEAKNSRNQRFSQLYSRQKAYLKRKSKKWTGERSGARDGAELMVRQKTKTSASIGSKHVEMAARDGSESAGEPSFNTPNMANSNFQQHLRRPSTLSNFFNRSFSSLRSRSSTSNSLRSSSEEEPLPNLQALRIDTTNRPPRTGNCNLRPMINRSKSYQSLKFADSPILESPLTQRPSRELPRPSRSNSTDTRVRSRTLNLGDLREEQGLRISKSSGGTIVTRNGSVVVRSPISPIPGMSSTFGFPAKNGFPARNGIPPKNARSSTDYSQNSEVFQKPIGASSTANGKVSGESLPPRLSADTPMDYFEKLQSAGILDNPKTIARTLEELKSLDFTKSIVQEYLDRTFSFGDEPLDMSLRKLLYRVELPKETQQIDQLLMCFSEKYYMDNCVQRETVKLYRNKDDIYILTFSLLLLHTDHFNSRNKIKMPKSDFIRNTYNSVSDDSVPREILEYFYENIISCKFVRAEDLKEDANEDVLNKKSRSSSFSWLNAVNMDPYYYIRTNTVGELQLDVKFNWSSYFKTNKIEDQVLMRTNKNLFCNEPQVQLVLNIDQSEFLLNNDTVTIEKYSKLAQSMEIKNATHLTTRVLNMGYLHRKEKLGSSAMLSMLNSESKYNWQRYFVILTSIGLHFFYTKTSFNLTEFELLRIHSNLKDPKSEVDGRGIFINVRDEDEDEQHELKPIHSIPIHELFATQTTAEDNDTFIIYSRNAKEYYRPTNELDTQYWINSINYTKSLCGLDLAFSTNDLKIDQYEYDIIGEIRAKHDDNMDECLALYNDAIKRETDNLEKLFTLARHYSFITPLNGKNKEILDHARLLKFRIDASWYEISKNQVSRDILLRYSRLMDGT